ncbi:11708_t:CDS:2 [Entrophospora sp. SA101]|nr:8371_t:CDS:2 [Entrophospora sp. SA101]CAJ0909058.1 11708_t:CDS:2 [Entrophospora sp. SA101]
MLGFMAFLDLATRRKTNIGQRLPIHIDVKIQRIINKNHNLNMNFQKLGYERNSYLFDMVGNLTIDKRGTKSVQARTTGNEKTRFTCVLKTIQNHHQLVFLKLGLVRRERRSGNEIKKKELLVMEYLWSLWKIFVTFENNNRTEVEDSDALYQLLSEMEFCGLGWISKIGFNENIEEWWKITSRIEKLQQANRRFGFTIMTNGTSVSVNLKRVIIHNVMNFSTKEWYSQVGFTR